jgi:hypothetical protein
MRSIGNGDDLRVNSLIMFLNALGIVEIGIYNIWTDLHVSAPPKDSMVFYKTLGGSLWYIK